MCDCCVVTRRLCRVFSPVCRTERMVLLDSQYVVWLPTYFW